MSGRSSDNPEPFGRRRATTADQIVHAVRGCGSSSASAQSGIPRAAVRYTGSAGPQITPGSKFRRFERPSAVRRTSAARHLRAPRSIATRLSARIEIAAVTPAIHLPARIQPPTHEVRDLAQLDALLRRERIEHSVSDVVDVPRGRRDRFPPPLVRQTHIRATSIAGCLRTHHVPARLEASDDMRQPRPRCVRAIGEFAHPQRMAIGPREHGHSEVVEVRQVVVAQQLSVEPPRQDSIMVATGAHVACSSGVNERGLDTTRSYGNSCADNDVDPYSCSNNQIGGHHDQHHHLRQRQHGHRDRQRSR